MTAPGRAPDLPDVSIVVLSYNRRDAIDRNIAALVAMVEQTGCELIVVDNASTDGSTELIRDLLGEHPGTRLVVNQANLGVAAGRNVGWRMATRDFILNLDDDIGVSAADVAHMARTLRETAAIGIVSPVIVDFYSGAVQYSYGTQKLDIANYQGACHMIRRDLAEAVGLNDERCSFGGEELDLSIRIRARGKGVIFTPDAKVLHDHKVRTGQEAKSRRQRWVYNFTRVFYKHFPLGAAVPFSLRYLVSHLVSGTRAFGPLFGLALIGEAWRGCRDGRQAHSPVPSVVVRFYRNPALRPEFGNRPLWHKFVRMIVSKRPMPE